MHVVSKALTLVSLFATAHASIWLKRPIASSSFHGGQSFLVTWMDSDSSTAGPIEKFNDASVELYIGPLDGQQYKVQDFGTIPNAIHHTHLAVKIDPDAGPDSDMYFIKIAPQDSSVAAAYSARFTLHDMSGSLPSGLSSEDLESSSKAASAADSSSSSKAASSSSSNSSSGSSKAASGSSSDSSSNSSSNISSDSSSDSPNASNREAASSSSVFSIASRQPSSAAQAAAASSTPGSSVNSPNQAVGVGSTLTTAASTSTAAPASTRVAGSSGLNNAADSTSGALMLAPGIFLVSAFALFASVW